MLTRENPVISESTKHTYILRRGEDLERCHQALVNADFETIEDIAHRMKGNGVTFGFPKISTLADRLERAARDSNSEEIRKQLSELQSYIHRCAS